MVTSAFSIGDRGAKVLELQKTLYKEGYLKVKPTGYYGALTKEAHAKYLKRNVTQETKATTTKAYPADIPPIYVLLSPTEINGFYQNVIRVYRMEDKMEGFYYRYEKKFVSDVEINTMNNLIQKRKIVP